MSYSHLRPYLAALSLALVVGVASIALNAASQPAWAAQALWGSPTAQAPASDRESPTLSSRGDRDYSRAADPQDAQQRLANAGREASATAAAPAANAAAKSETDTKADEPRELTLEESFIQKIAPAAQQSQRETGVPASVTLAQAILESDWGRSALSTLANNFFGIKAHDRPGSAGVVWMNTWEVSGGSDVIANEPFRAYNDPGESIKDHGLYLAKTPLYKKAMQNTEDPKLFAQLIHQAGYATDPAYASKLIRLMDRLNLYAYDVARIEWPRLKLPIPR